MRRYLSYLNYVIRHKWFVLVAGLRIGVPIWVLICHDWTKFLPDEFIPYARTFYAPGGSKQYNPGPAFDRAWLKHQKRNKHHWQYWLLSPDSPRPRFEFRSTTEGSKMVTRLIDLTDKEPIVEVVDYGFKDGPRINNQQIERLWTDINNTPVALEMPDLWRREMLADWMGAGRALGNPDTLGWYEANRNQIFIHPATRAWVDEMLDYRDLLTGERPESSAYS